MGQPQPIFKCLDCKRKYSAKEFHLRKEKPEEAWESHYCGKCAKKAPHWKHVPKDVIEYPEPKRIP